LLDDKVLNENRTLSLSGLVECCTFEAYCFLPASLVVNWNLESGLISLWIPLETKFSIFLGIVFSAASSLEQALDIALVSVLEAEIV